MKISQTTISTNDIDIEAELYENHLKNNHEWTKNYFDYINELKKKQKEHLKNVGINNNDAPYAPCLHESCPECVGTGVKRDGSTCIHMLSCPCIKCTPYSTGGV